MPWHGDSESRAVSWPQAPRRAELPQSQVRVLYPPGSFVVEALAMMGALAMTGTLSPAWPLAQAGLGVPRLGWGCPAWSLWGQPGC